MHMNWRLRIYLNVLHNMEKISGMGVIRIAQRQLMIGRAYI